MKLIIGVIYKIMIDHIDYDILRRGCINLMMRLVLLVMNALRHFIFGQSRVSASELGIGELLLILCGSTCVYKTGYALVEL